MILVELVNEPGACLAAAMTEAGEWEHVGDIGELSIPVHRNRTRVVFRLFGLADRANALDIEEWHAARTLHAIRATRAGHAPALLPQPENRRKRILPRDGAVLGSPPGALLIAADHLTPEEFAGAEKAWAKLALPEVPPA